MNKEDYCVYLTIYFGDMLPKRYVGSSKLKTVLAGYNGTVKSKKYKSTYREEQENNKALFKTRPISYHSTREEALIEELRLQIKYDVVKSDKYMNMAYANPNGCFGRNMSGESHPSYGKTRNEDTRNKIAQTLKDKYKRGVITSPFSRLSFEGEKNGFFGKHHTEETKQKMRKPKKHVPKFECTHCGKIYDAGNLSQHIKRKHPTL
jgi:hypothetical protein